MGTVECPACGNEFDESVVSGWSRIPRRKFYEGEGCPKCEFGAYGGTPEEDDDFIEDVDISEHFF